MQGLITLDFGNSHPHAGIFQKTQNEWQLLKVVPVKELAIFLPQFLMSAHNTSIVLSEVSAHDEELTALIEQGYLLTRLKDYWRGEKFAGMPVNYAKTLGEDRLIEAYYVYKKLKTSALIIDAGTYVTMDVVTERGFEGGFIIPGIEVYLKSFLQGERLKDVTLSSEVKAGLPDRTAEAMTGSYSAFASLARELVTSHQLSRVIVTGGQAEVWNKLLVLENTPVESNPHLIHTSLHAWFTTQIEPI